MKSLLIAVNDPNVIRSIGDVLREEYRVESASGKEGALEALRQKRHDVFFIDLDFLAAEPAMENNIKLSLQPFWTLYPSLPIVVMTKPERIRDALAAVKAGASDFLTYPATPDEVRYVIESIFESIILRSELDYLRDRFWKTESLEQVQTRSTAMKTVFEKVRSVAPTKSTVLLVGETGTGKGVLAKLIHRHSNRSEAQFIAVHCGAIPETLIESELFGHERGAFTGAVRRKLGKFEIAKGGTIFLDEIGTITPPTQIKLLQVLQEGTFQRVGGEEDIAANVRVISATNIDLKLMTDEGRFRKDLYYRLNVFPIEIPPLRDRAEDIHHFVELFLKKLNQFHSKQILGVHPTVLKAFHRYPWPGNIRELENLMERAYILEPSTTLTPESFPAEIFDNTPSLPAAPVDTTVTMAEARKRGIADIERNYIKEVLSRHRGKINESAKTSGISTRQLHKLMQKYGLRKESFK